MAGLFAHPPRDKTCAGQRWWVHLEILGGWVEVELVAYRNSAARAKARAREDMARGRPPPKGKVQAPPGSWQVVTPLRSALGVLTPWGAIIDGKEARWSRNRPE